MVTVPTVQSQTLQVSVYVGPKCHNVAANDMGTGGSLLCHRKCHDDLRVRHRNAARPGFRL
jgi:hypothetical protein